MARGLIPRVAVAATTALLISCGGDSPSEPSSRLTHTFLRFTSAPGDWVGQGETHEYTLESGDWSITAGGPDDPRGIQELAFDYSDGVAWWSLHLAAPRGEVLKRGTYTNAARWPFQGTAQPGLDFSGSGRGCNELSGEFTIHELVLSPGNAIERFHVEFEQHCEMGAPALLGELGVLANPWR